MFNSRQRERDREQLAGARAEVQSWQARLASDISTLDPGDDPMSRQAMLDASERHNAAGALLSTASTQAELQVAQRIVVEGLTATRLVRQHLGLPLGPELPPSATATVSAPTSVTVEDEHHIAHPDYHPQQPHFFGGGSFDNATAPPGYYRTPFWKKALALGGAVVGAEMVGDLVGDMFGPDRGARSWDGDGYSDRDGGGGFGFGDNGGDDTF
ncbi:MAG: hypothetical protein J0I49_11720 [Pseudonocardia sp.]|uniref:hypothetical protein n=1 Tax=Pseudonocardia sp. TaxID=60912 RepID=UPI001ACFFD12|nr:hypothetical protein [Pseudonocardia sp.]MBN9098763.1 hypothetical protein [Pseudonocardia sp.]